MNHCMRVSHASVKDAFDIQHLLQMQFHHLEWLHAQY